MPEKSGYPKTSPLQIWPKGLLGFLQLKNGGEFPQRLASEALLPTLELAKWYLETNQEVIDNTELGGVASPALAAGNTSFGGLVVPAKEFWVVHDYSATVTNTNGTGQHNTCLTVTHPGKTSVAPFRLGDYFTVAAGTAGNAVVIHMTREPFILGPGGGLAAHSILSSFAAAVTITPIARITRLPLV